MSHKNIVVVDDERGMTQLLKLELESEGFKVFSALDGKSGLELIQKIHPDLAILDVMMPDLNGYEVLKRLKNEESTKNMPVIMLTAKGLEEDVQKGLDLGADDYIAKPFHGGLLIKRIRMLLNKFGGASRPKKILIAEDEPEMRKMLALELETSGYQVFEAADGQEAFKLAQDIKPDLIISDVLMPNMNGGELIKKIRETDFGREIPVMVLTARGKMKDYFDVMDVNEFVVKPFEPHDLLERVRTLIEKGNQPESMNEVIEKDGQLIQKKRILILENDPLAYKELKTAFEDYGYAVKMVTTPAECLEQAISFHPDLVFSKFIIEGMSGTKLVDLLRGMSPLKKTPIIIYSNTIFGGEKESVFAAGATEFLSDVNSVKLLKKANELFGL